MDEFEVAANTEEVATPSINNTVTEPQTQEEPVQQQDITQTQSFAKRLAEERAKIQAELKAELEGQYTPYKSVLQEAAESYGFNSIDEYLEAYNQQKQQQALEAQAQEMNASPEVLRELNTLKEKIAQQEQEKQQALEAENRKQWESQVKGQVNEVLELAKKDGVNITEEQLVNAMMEEGIADPRKAYKLIKPEIDVESLKKSAVEEYFTNLKKGNRPVEGAGTSPVIVSSSPKTFEEARNGARDMIRAMLNQ